MPPRSTRTLWPVNVITGPAWQDAEGYSATFRRKPPGESCVITGCRPSGDGQRHSWAVEGAADRPCVSRDRSFGLPMLLQASSTASYVAAGAAAEGGRAVETRRGRRSRTDSRQAIRCVAVEDVRLYPLSVSNHRCQTSP